MSPKDLDKLFRNALGEGQATPRPEAWARVAHGLPQVQRKRRILWWPYAAAVSVALAAVGTWWMTHSRLEVAPSQQLTASNQQLAASNRQPATSNQLPLAASSHGSAAFELAFLPHMEAELGDERVPLLERRIAQAAVEAAPEFALAPEVPRRRYAQLAASVQNVWAAVSEFREAEVPVEVTVEVHVPAVVLQRINQTRTLAENLTESWSTLPSRRSH